MTVRRGYVDGRFGQVHYWLAGDSTSQVPMYCLHATAYSGQTFLPLMQNLEGARRVVALDTPGYGSSDGPASELDFESYAHAIAEAVHRVEATQHGAPGTVDIFGYHTGALLAAEVAVLYPELVGRLVLMGIPYFTGEVKTAWREKLVHVTRLTESFEQFRARWDYFITHRTPGLTLDRAFACFVDELRAYPKDWWVHKALFDYKAEERLPLVKAPVLVINTATALADASRSAALQMPGANVVEVAGLGGAPFDLGPDLLSKLVEEFLNRKN